MVVFLSVTISILSQQENPADAGHPTEMPIDFLAKISYSGISLVENGWSQSLTYLSTTTPTVCPIDGWTPLLVRNISSPTLLDKYVNLTNDGQRILSQKLFKNKK